MKTMINKICKKTIWSKYLVINFELIWINIISLIINRYLNGFMYRCVNIDNNNDPPKGVEMKGVKYSHLN